MPDIYDEDTIEEKLLALGLKAKPVSQDRSLLESSPDTQLGPNVSIQPPEEYPGQLAFEKSFGKRPEEPTPRFSQEELRDPKRVAFLKSFTQNPPTDEEIAAAQDQGPITSTAPASVPPPPLPMSPSQPISEGNFPVAKAERSLGERYGTGNQEFPQARRVPVDEEAVGRGIKAERDRSLEAPTTGAEFDARLEAKKPALFQKQYAGLSPEEADRMIMAGEVPPPSDKTLPPFERDLTAESPEPPQTAPVSPESSLKEVAKDVVHEELKPTEPINPLERTDLGDEAFKQAQETARQRQLIAGLGEAAGTFAAVAPGKQFDRSFYDEQYKQAQQPVENLKERRDAFIKNTQLSNYLIDSQIKKMDLKQKQDLENPNSPGTKALKGIIEFTHKDIDFKKIPGWDTINGREAETFSKYLETQAKLEASKEDKETNREWRKQMADQRQEVQDNKDFAKLAKDVNSGVASSRSAFGRNANTIRQAGAIEQLIEQVKHQPGAGADKRQYFEVARSLDSMLSQGIGTISGTKELLPQTSGSQFASILEWVTNKPQDPSLQKFLERTADTVRREKAYAYEQNAKLASRFAPGASHLKAKDLDRWKAIWAANDIATDDNGNIIGSSIPSAQPGQQVPQPLSDTNLPAATFDQDVLNYAQKHNITPEQAQAIKNKRLGKQ